jgi:hypothetical protein
MNRDCISADKTGVAPIVNWLGRCHVLDMRLDRNISAASR